MNTSLCRDLFLRYTRPGDVVLDPFLGRGTSLLGCTLGRHLIGVELEPKFVEMARQNYAHLCSQLPGIELGEAVIVQGDSRHLDWLPAFDGVRVSDAIGSPPFGGSESVDNRTTSTIQHHRGGNATRDGYHEAANIANLPAGGVSAAISSPPYSDVASRNRSEEPYSLALDPVLKARYGSGDTARHIDGYGHTAGQIGALAHNGIDSVCTSPEYGQSHLVAGARRGEPFRPWQERRGAQGYHGEDVRNQPPEEYAHAMLAVLKELYRVVNPGGCLVLVTGNFVRQGDIVDLAADTIRLAEAAGWIDVERWEHRKASVSFWRRLHAKQAAEKGLDPATVTVTSEDVLVFVRDYQGWEFQELALTTVAPADLSTRGTAEPAVHAPRLFPEDSVTKAAE